jgi:hypothetical protein
MNNLPTLTIVSCITRGARQTSRMVCRRAIIVVSILFLLSVCMVTTALRWLQVVEQACISSSQQLILSQAKYICWTFERSNVCDA